MKKYLFLVVKCCVGWSFSLKLQTNPSETGAKAMSSGYFGNSSRRVNVKEVRCSGSEYNVTDCDIAYTGNRTVHAACVGVQCQPVEGVYREGDVRLVGGPHNWEGRVEIFLMKEWGTLIDHNWTDSDASVVCRQLQLPKEDVTIPSCCKSYSYTGNGLNHTYRIECAGSEKNITLCPKANSVTKGSAVRVQCKPGEGIKEGSIRLIGGGYMWEGRVEIYSAGYWSTITYSSYSNYPALTVCRQLGYIAQISSDCCAKYGQGIGPIFFKTPTCHGWEHRISECKENQVGTREIYHSEDWSVRCQINGPEPGDARRYYQKNIGNVEVYFSGIWQLVADSTRSWTQLNSMVFCRELGRSIEGISMSYGQGNLYRPQVPYVMDKINCSGNEQRLSDCPHEINYSLKPYRGIRINCGSGNWVPEDMRLVGGESEREGRLELRVHSVWYTVCGRFWTAQNTAVICRYLGFSDNSTGHFLSSDVVGLGYGPIFSDLVNCNGSETRLWPYQLAQRFVIQCYILGIQCTQGCPVLSHYHGCSRVHDIGVKCEPASCLSGALRLTNGVDEMTGYVEMCYNKRWATISTVYWTFSNARVACIELGYDSFRFWRNNINFGRVKTLWYTKHFNCSGSEQRLSLCPNKSLSYYYSREVVVSCSLAHCNDGEIRLMDGEEVWEGRLEVCFNGRWGTVGSQGWSFNNTQTVCYDLGYSMNGQQIFTVPQSLSKPVYINDVVCSLSSLKLTDCNYSHYSGDSSQVVDVSLSCINASCSDGDIRVVEGRNDSHGKLEVCFNHRWRSVDGKKWTTNNTRVVCEQLGMNASEVSYYQTDHLTSKPVWLTKVVCTGTEKRLIDCSYNMFYGPITTSTDIIITCIEMNINDQYHTSSQITTYHQSLLDVTPSVNQSLAVTAEIQSSGLSQIQLYSAVSGTSTFLSGTVVAVVLGAAAICYKKRKTKQSGISTGRNLSYVGISIIEGKIPEDANQSKVSGAPEEPVYSEISSSLRQGSKHHTKISAETSMTYNYDDHIYKNVIRK